MNLCATCNSPIDDGQNQCLKCSSKEDSLKTLRLEAGVGPDIEMKGINSDPDRTPIGQGSIASPLSPLSFSEDEVVSNRYRVIEEVGSGAFGTVYKAFDLTLKKLVALKQIKTNDHRTLELFHTEVRNAQALTHRNLCRVHDLAEDQGRHFFSMRYAEGQSLDKHLRKKKRLGKGEIVKIASQICNGLEELHQAGYLHRDLKPPNIIQNHDGTIQITDFGLVELTERVQAGAIAGTAPYIAPEILKREKATPKSDIYSLGVILYEMSTGKLPFRGSNLPEFLRQIELGATPPSALVDGFDNRLEEIILSCLAFSPELRPLSAREVETALAIAIRHDDRKINPFISGRAVRGAHFFGSERESNLKLILRRVETNQSTFVVGDLCMGKTSFLLRLADRLESELENVVVKIFPLRSVSDSHTPTDFWREAIEPLLDHINHSDHEGISDALEAVAEFDYTNARLRNLFSNLLAKGYRLTLLLDEFDHLLTHPNFPLSFFANLRTLITSTHSLIIIPSSRFPMKEMDKKSPLPSGQHGSKYFNYFTEIKLSPLDEEDVEELLTMGDAYLTVEDRLFVRNLAGRHPFLIQMLAEVLFDTTGSLRWHKAARKFSENISVYFEDLWNGWSNPCRSVAILLVTLESSRRAGVDIHLNFDEALSSRDNRLGIEELSRAGLVGAVDQSKNRRMRHSFNWDGERWCLGAEIFVWWIWGIANKESRSSDIYDDWLESLRNDKTSLLNRMSFKAIEEINAHISRFDHDIDTMIENFIISSIRK